MNISKHMRMWGWGMCLFGEMHKESINHHSMNRVTYAPSDYYAEFLAMEPLQFHHIGGMPFPEVSNLAPSWNNVKMAFQSVSIY